MRRFIAALALSASVLTGAAGIGGFASPAAADKVCTFLGNTSDKKLMYGCTDGVDIWLEYL